VGIVEIGSITNHARDAISVSIIETQTELKKKDCRVLYYKGQGDIDAKNNFSEDEFIFVLNSVRGLERSELGGSHGCPGRLWDQFL